MFADTISANKYKSSKQIGLRHPVLDPHALFSFRSSMGEIFARRHTTYSAIEKHRVSAVVLVVLVFVPHSELANFFKRLLRVATFILVFCMC